MGITTVIKNAGLSSNDYSSASSAVQTLTDLHLAPVSGIAAVTSLQSADSKADAVAAGLSAAQAGVAVIQAVGQRLPGAGTTLTAGSLVNNAVRARDEINAGGLTRGTAADLAADLTAAAAIVAAAALTGPAAVAWGIGLTLISAGLTVSNILNPETAGNTDAVSSILDEWDRIVETVRDAVIPDHKNQRIITDAVLDQ